MDRPVLHASARRHAAMRRRGERRACMVADPIRAHPVTAVTRIAFSVEFVTEALYDGSGPQLEPWLVAMLHGLLRIQVGHSVDGVLGMEASGLGGVHGKVGRKQGGGDVRNEWRASAW